MDLEMVPCEEIDGDEACGMPADPRTRRTYGHALCPDHEDDAAQELLS